MQMLPAEWAEGGPGVQGQSQLAAAGGQEARGVRPFGDFVEILGVEPELPQVMESGDLSQFFWGLQRAGEPSIDFGLYKLFKEPTI